MTDQSKKHGFLGRITRVFTRGKRDAYNDILFKDREWAGDEVSPALECPENWSREAAELLAEQGAATSVPAHTRAVEENTVPSWLWRRVGKGAELRAETSAKEVIDRVVGAAAYAGWKQELFADEAEARHFFDEARAMLMQRYVAFEPGELATLGLHWAYGLRDQNQNLPAVASGRPRSVDIPNSTIDAIVRGVANKAIRARWQKLWPLRGEAPSVTLRLSDIAADWGVLPPAPAARAVLDLMAFRHNDGWVNIDALCHAVRLTVILLDLRDKQAVQQLELGFCNLAPLLMALAVGYDSDAGRAVASAISAIITAEAYATSAELAGLRGPGADFVADRETALRALRNHRRAAYGDRNDYEKISVLPAPLMLEDSPDLALVAIAQRRWEDVLALARQNGLRHVQVTALTASPSLTLFMEAAASGIAPMPALTVLRPAADGTFRQEVNPSVTEGLRRLGYDDATTDAFVKYIAGAGTLEKAPGINPIALRAKGLDEAALWRIENYLPLVHDVRLACTPWVLGVDFCQNMLKIPAAKLHSPRFDLLKHLGFTAQDIAATNAYCYGHGTICDADELRQQHVGVFLRADETTADARIRMAAAVQGFISGDAGLELTLPPGLPVERHESLLLSVWRQGLKSVTMIYDGNVPAVGAMKSERTAVEARPSPKKLSPSTYIHTKGPNALPKRTIRSKAGSGIVSMGRRTKPSTSPRGKRS
ncbi:MAG: hypothetical protein M3N08_03705 [Pseudomonadota bacterium]|nr:hypothetical protein [Pseudomonadota bacterium]